MDVAKQEPSVLLTEILSFPHVGPRVELKWSGLRPPLLPVCPPLPREGALTVICQEVTKDIINGT